MSTDRGPSSHRLGRDRETQLAHFDAERRRRAVPRPGFHPLDPDRRSPQDDPDGTGAGPAESAGAEPEDPAGPGGESPQSPSPLPPDPPDTAD